MASNPSSGASFGNLLLDRKRMEEERLARLKRPSSCAEPSDLPASQRLKTITGAAIAVEKPPSTALPGTAPPGAMPPVTALPGTMPPSTTLPSMTLPDTPSRAAAPPRPVVLAGENMPDSARFLTGSVKRTWAAGHPRQADDITINEIIDKDKLELGVISSFQWDDEWLLSKLDLRRTRLLLIAFAASDEMKSTMLENAPPNTRFCFPPMLADRGSMHSKLQLLKYQNYLRIVVPTGNMTPYDWGETGVMENMVFIIDLPRLQSPDEFIPTGFSTELCRFLSAMTLDESLINSLTNYDFSRTTDLAFVHTIAGHHKEEDEWRYTGYCGLGQAIQSLGLATEGELEVDLVCASLGSLTESFLTAMYSACRGDSGLKALDARRQAPKGSAAAGMDAAAVHLRNRFRVYFPSALTVMMSRGGEQAGGTICFQRKWWASAKFPRHVLRDSTSTRPGLLLHTKAILARKVSAHEKPGPAGWAYIGSANLSESAWGKLVKDRLTAKPRLDCFNWECGVVLPARARAGGGEAAEDSGMAMFSGIFPMPVWLPAPSYSSTGPGSHPWFFTDERRD